MAYLLWPCYQGMSSGASSHELSRPEALGSPDGLCCPTRSLLTMASSETLGFSPRLICFVLVGLCPTVCIGAEAERLPNLLHVSLSAVPSSVPRRTRWISWTVSSPSALAFTISAQVRHLHVHPRRFSRGLCNEAAKFALCYGPVSCSPFTGKNLYFRAFTSLSHLNGSVEYHYAAKQSIAGAGLSPARNAALWAANRGTEKHFFLFGGGGSRQIKALSIQRQKTMGVGP